MPTLPGQVTGTASIPVRDRLWRKTQANGDCWEWTGAKTTWGYGEMTVAGKRSGVHRVAYEQYIGPIPEGASVLHRCDNPPCWRPSHLFLGTQADNMRDKREKGRAASGARNGAARLTAEQYESIVERVSAGERQVDVARSLGVTPQAVNQFLRRRRATA